MDSKNRPEIVQLACSFIKVIAKNAILLMAKTADFPSAQPKFMSESFPENSPNFNYSCDVSRTWLEINKHFVTGIKYFSNAIC